ncbi:MAG: hypothetical protein OEZ41_09090 [Nitrospirota bacterium]|nr:hypothetical protein [Nitrospirota bacterium]
MLQPNLWSAGGEKQPRWLVPDKFRNIDSAHRIPNSFAVSSVDHTILSPRTEYGRAVLS